MKYVPLALLTFATIGCGHNEFDVSPAQVSRHLGAPKPAGDLPSGTIKTGVFKKGDRLPDGTIADQAVKISSDGR